MRRLLHCLLPNHCHLCGLATPEYLCPGCQEDLPRLGEACPSCALPLEHDATFCADCLETPKPFQLSLCPFRYAYPLDDLLHRFKQQRHIGLGAYLARSLANCLQMHYEQRPDALIPMPQHWRRNWQRGFNPAQVIGAQLSKLTAIPLRSAAVKLQATPQQKGLDRQTRLSNLDKAFAVQASLDGQHLVIVDDIMTTCASAMRLSQTLLAAGAKRVDIAVIARTPKYS